MVVNCARQVSTSRRYQLRQQHQLQRNMIFQNNNGWDGRREYLSDVLNIAAFIVGLENYGQNLDQNSAQDMLKAQSEDIHNHLKMQDEKIDKILELLKGR